MLLHHLVEAPSSTSAQTISVYFFFPGSYFANHFIMGGEKFDSTHPEGYLFGENSDLNFLGNRPVVVGAGGTRGGGDTGPGCDPSQSGCDCVCHGGARYEAAGCHPPRAEPAWGWPERTL